MNVRALVFAGVLVGCSSAEETPAVKRTAAEQRKVDSTVGASSLPGASGVRGALRVSDSAAARKAALDSMSRD